jgi:hypothetical protein
MPHELPIASAALNAVFRHIDTHEDDFLRRVMDYVRHPSISAANTGIVEVAALPTMPRTRT